MQVVTYLVRGGGIQIHVLDLSAWLRARGHFVLNAGYASDDDFPPPEHLVRLPLDRVSTFERTGRYELPIRLWKTFSSVLKLRQSIRRHKIELLHAHETAPLAVAWLASRGLNLPIAFTYHGASPDRLADIVGMTRRMADVVISPSRTSMEMLVSRGLPRSKVRQIGIAVQHLPAVDPQRVGELRKELLGAAGTHLVLSLSRLTEQKGLDAMVRIAKRASRELPGLRIVVGGNGPLHHMLEALAREEGVGDVIRFVGLITDPNLYLSASDIYLLTSRWEELPISIVESFRAGLPVIATDCGGVGELLDDSVGRLCAVDDEEALAAALVMLCRDHELRGQLSRNAKVRSEERRFSVDHVYQENEALYKDALAHKKRTV